MLDTVARRRWRSLLPVDYSGIDNKEGSTRRSVGQPKMPDKLRGRHQRTKERNRKLTKEKNRRSFASGLFSMFFGEKARRHPVESTLLNWEFVTEREANLVVYLSQGAVVVPANNTFARIDRSKSQEELMGILDHAGFAKQVESFRQHVLDRQDYVEEGGHPDSKLESLRAAAQFLVRYNPPYSDIEADFEGNVEFEWMLSPRVVEPDKDQDFWGDGSGYMAIRFVSSKTIEFAMLSGPKAKGKERMRVSGTFSHRKMNTIIKMFKDRMVIYD